jgi:ribonuclease HII
MPDLSLESLFDWDAIAGVDEVGYGAWAGPVVVAAVVIKKAAPDDFLVGIQDSKQLSALQRQRIYDHFISYPLWGEWAVSYVPADRIAKGNVLTLTLQAMAQAVTQTSAQAVIVDGCHEIPCDLPQKSFPKADQRSISVALASIIAKVTRDNLMSRLAEEYPLFHWEKNKGYGTLLHRTAIGQYGLTVHHRPHYCRKAILI